MAAKQAYEAAIAEESVAETKYDTFGLEASYLAHGQSQRVYECEKEWRQLEKWQPPKFHAEDGIALGALIHLERNESPLGKISRWFFMSPCAGGLSVKTENNCISLVTVSSPVGKALFKLGVDDEVTLLESGRPVLYKVVSID